MRWLACIVLLTLLAVLPGCSRGCGKPDLGPERSERVRVTVSIFPLYDLARRIAGPDADVTLLIQPGRNEHSFDPTPRDIETVAKAKVGIMIGLGLDTWMEKLMTDAAPNASILKVGDHVPTLTVESDPIGAQEHRREHGGANDEHDHEVKGAKDPHVWLDPQRARAIVRAIAHELGRVDAAHAAGYRERAAELDASLVELDKEAEARLGALEQRSFVTFHGSFSYFAERYRLNILAVIEPFPGSQPTGEYVSKVLAVIKEKKVPALFSEPQLDPRPARILAEEAKIPLGVLDPVGGGPETDSYEKMIRFDIAQLEKHLR